MSSRLLLALVLALAGCQTSNVPRGIERLALLPFDNLSGDRSLDWVARGAQIVLKRQLSVSRTISVSDYANVPAAILGNATRMVHGTIEKASGGVRLVAFIEDGLSHRQSGERIEMQVAPAQLTAALDRLAHTLAPDASPSAPMQPAALAAYVDAIAIPDPAARQTALAAAARLDPKAALPVLALAETGAAIGHRDEVQAALAAVAERTLDPIERKQAAILAANLNQDRAAQVAALTGLVAAAPMQPGMQVMAGTFLARLQQYAPAVTAYEQSLRVDPANIDVLNRLAYTNAYLGRLPAARKALESYQALAPNDPNPVDTLGDVHYLGGEFKAAADYYLLAYGKGPQFEGGRSMLKAAYARMLTGNFQAADQAAEQYAKTASESPQAQVARAHYLFSSGQAAAGLALLPEGPGPAASIYLAHRCGLLLGSNRAAAQAAARAAITAGANPGAILCLFVSQPSASVAEWKTRAERAFTGNQGTVFGRQALAYALFYDGHYADAYPQLEELALATHADPGSATDGDLQAMLAECQWRTGRWSTARETVRRWPLPAQDSIFSGRQAPMFMRALLETAAHQEDYAVLKRWSGTGGRIRSSVD